MIKYCVNCLYNVNELWCSSPKNGISLVTGEANMVFAHTSRKDSSQCGIRAMYFQPKKVVLEQPKWKKLFTKIKK